VKYIYNSNKKTTQIIGISERSGFIKDSIFNAVLFRPVLINTLIDRLVKVEFTTEATEIKGINS